MTSLHKLYLNSASVTKNLDNRQFTRHTCKWKVTAIKSNCWMLCDLSHAFIVRQLFYSLSLSLAVCVSVYSSFILILLHFLETNCKPCHCLTDNFYYTLWYSFVVHCFGWSNAFRSLFLHIFIIYSCRFQAFNWYCFLF